MSGLKLAARAAFAVVLIGGLARVPLAWPAGEEIVIRANAIEPHVFRATMGQRVNFVKRVDLPVHVEFGLDPTQHHVVQIRGTAPYGPCSIAPGRTPTLCTSTPRKRPRPCTGSWRWSRILSARGFREPAQRS